MAVSGEDIDDDPTIADACRMLRRIPPGWVNEPPRPDSSNFHESTKDEYLSVTAWLSPNDLTATVSLAPTFGVVSVTAGELRAAGYKIKRIPEDGNANHCGCFGLIKPSARRGLKKASKWVKAPERDGLDPSIFEPFDTF